MSLGWEIILIKHMKYQSSSHDNVQEITKNENTKAEERLGARTFLLNSNQGKYGCMLSILNSKNLLKNDQFTKTVVDSQKMLTIHKHVIADKK